MISLQIFNLLISALPTPHQLYISLNSVRCSHFIQTALAGWILSQCEMGWVGIVTGENCVGTDLVDMLFLMFQN